eukprot:scaffold4493_cov390-Prasinococcus_capsulatus_cf.AAC.5
MSPGRSPASSAGPPLMGVTTAHSPSALKVTSRPTPLSEFLVLDRVVANSSGLRKRVKGSSSSLSISLIAV